MNFVNEILENIWKDRYQKNGESFDENLWRVAKHCGSNTQEIEMFYDVMKKRYFFPAGRTMSNSGIGKDLTLNNCFVAPQIKDSLDDIFNKVALGARTHQKGGGIGYDFSQLRPNGTPTSNDAIASGAVSFMDVFNSQTATILQGNRRGANMGVMNIYNMDIEEFINAKSYDEGKLNHFNVSVMVDNDFMSAVKRNKNVFLHYPVYSEDGKILKDETKWKYKKEISATYLWDLIMKKAYDNGEPGIFFYDNLNKDNNLWYIENIVATNPCVTGETVILTNDGYKRIDSLVGIETEIWNGYEFSSATPRITGHNQDMVKIEFSDGSTLTCTLYHKFILNNDTRIEAKNLKLGDKLAKFNFPVIDGDLELSEKDAYTRGFFCGDGTIKNTDTNYNIIALYDVKKELLPYLDYVDLFDQGENQDNRYVINLPKTSYSKDFVPTNKYTINTRLNWLAGILDSDGCVNSPDGTLSISSNNKKFLLDIKYMINTLGCNGTVSLMKNEGYEIIRDSNDEPKEYYRHNCYRLIINATNVKKLMDLGLNTHRVKLIANPNRDASRFIQITGIEFLTEKEETVYCFTEEKNHSGIFNGVMTAQCAEYLAGTIYGNNPQTGEKLNPEEFGGACNLGSLFLHNFVEHPFTKEAKVNYDDLLYAINVGVRLLDNIIDINNFPDKIYENYQKSFRTIGLGVTGLADMLAMLNLKYNSKESQNFIYDLMNYISYNAFKSSMELAKEKGSFPFLDRDKYIMSGFLQKHAKDNLQWEHLLDDIITYGIRNSKIMSIAPTGTLSLTFGNNCSSGIEPIFSLEYDRKVKFGGQSDDNVKIVKMQDYAYGLWEQTKEGNIVDKNIFTTAMEMSVDDHVEMLKSIVYHVDMSVSKTINVPTDYSFEATKDIYMKSYENGVKGCTIFRPNAIRQGILISDKDKINEESIDNNIQELPRGYIIEADDNVVGKKRTLTTGCGTLHCSAFFDPVTGELLETYFSKGSSGGCNNFMTGLSRMVSLSARAGVDVYSIADQLNSSGTCPSYSVRTVTKHDTSKGSSCPVALGNVLIEMYLEMQSEINDEIEYKSKPKQIYKKNSAQKNIEKSSESNYSCPQCGEELTFEGGCNTCKSCGWSKCS